MRSRASVKSGVQHALENKNALAGQTAVRGARDVAASAVVAAAADPVVHAAAAPLLRLHLGLAVRRLR